MNSGLFDRKPPAAAPPPDPVEGGGGDSGLFPTPKPLATMPQPLGGTLAPAAPPISQSGLFPAPKPVVPAPGHVGQHQDVVTAAAGQYGLDPAMFSRLVMTESSGNAGARSVVGAMGLTQLMAATARQLGVADPFDPKANARGGAKYLRQLIDQFGGDTRKALMAYNWGPGNMRSGKPIPASVQAYADKILAGGAAPTQARPMVPQIPASLRTGAQRAAATAQRHDFAKDLAAFLGPGQLGAPPKPQKGYDPFADVRDAQGQIDPIKLMTSGPKKARVKWNGTVWAGDPFETADLPMSRLEFQKAVDLDRNDVVLRDGSHMPMQKARALVGKKTGVTSFQYSMSAPDREELQQAFDYSGGGKAGPGATVGFNKGQTKAATGLKVKQLFDQTHYKDGHEITRSERIRDDVNAMTTKVASWIDGGTAEPSMLAQTLAGIPMFAANVGAELQTLGDPHETPEHIAGAATNLAAFAAGDVAAKALGELTVPMRSAIMRSLRKTDLGRIALGGNYEKAVETVATKYNLSRGKATQMVESLRAGDASAVPHDIAEAVKGANAGPAPHALTKGVDANLRALDAQGSLRRMAYQTAPKRFRQAYAEYLEGMDPRITDHPEGRKALSAQIQNLFGVAARDADMAANVVAASRPVRTAVDAIPLRGRENPLDGNGRIIRSEGGAGTAAIRRTDNPIKPLAPAVEAPAVAPPVPETGIPVSAPTPPNLDGFKAQREAVELNATNRRDALGDSTTHYTPEEVRSLGDFWNTPGAVDSLDEGRAGSLWTRFNDALGKRDEIVAENSPARRLLDQIDDLGGAGGEALHAHATRLYQRALEDADAAGVKLSDDAATFLDHHQRRNAFNPLGELPKGETAAIESPEKAANVYRGAPEVATDVATPHRDAFRESVESLIPEGILTRGRAHDILAAQEARANAWAREGANRTPEDFYSTHAPTMRAIDADAGGSVAGETRRSVTLEQRGEVGSEAWRRTRADFLGDPKITSTGSASELKPRLYPVSEAAPAEPFMNGRYTIKRGEGHYVVMDGEKPIAMYDGENVLVVDKKYRRQGIGSELVHDYRTRVPDAAPAKYRTKVSQAIQEGVHERIVREAVDAGKPVPAEVLRDYPELARRASSLDQTNKGKLQGRITFTEGEKPVVELIRGQANVSTVLHELAHSWRRTLPEGDLEILSKHYGDFATTEAEERFARGVERYFKDGVAPVAELKGVFDRFRIWLGDIYRKVKGSPIEEEVHPDVRSVLDRMLGGGEPVAAAEPRESVKLEYPNRALEDPPVYAGSNAAGNDLREAVGLDALPDTPTLRTTPEEARVGFDPAKTLTRARRIVADVANGDKAPVFTEEEQLHMGMLKAATGRRFNQLSTRRAALIEAGESTADIDVQLSRAQADVDAATLADKYAGTEWGRAGQARNTAIADDYTAAGLYRSWVNAAKAPLGAADREEAQRLAGLLAEAEDRITAAEAEAALAGPGRARGRRGGGSPSRRSVDELRSSRADATARIKEKIAARAKAAGGRLNNFSNLGYEVASGFYEIAPDIVQVAKDFAEEGVTVLADVIAKVREHLKTEAGLDLSDDDVRAALSGRYERPKVDRSKAATQLSAWRNELSEARKNATAAERALAAAERDDLRQQTDTQKKAEKEAAYWNRLAEGAEKRKAFEQERIARDKAAKAMAAVKEEARKAAQTERAARRKAYEDAFGERARLEKSIADLQAKIAGDDYTRKARRTEDPMLRDLYIDREVLKIKANERRAELEQAQARKDMTPAQRALAEALNVPRSLVASTDLSAPLNQGAFVTYSHPVESLRAMGRMMNALRNEDVYKRVLGEVRADPHFDKAVASGLQISAFDFGDLRDPGGDLFISKLLGHSVEVGSGNLRVGLNPIAASERAYGAYLNKLRMDMYSRMVSSAEDGFRIAGIPVAKGKDLTREQLKDVADWVNVATGAGVGDAATALKTWNRKVPVMFAPSYLVSRWQLSAGGPGRLIHLIKTNPNVAAQVVADYVRFVGMAGGILTAATAAGAKVERDSRSTNFGKIKLDDGATVDPFGGILAPYRLSNQLLRGTKNASGLHKAQPQQTLGQYFGNKVQPILGAAFHISEGKAFGKSYDVNTPKGRLNVAESFAPIFTQGAAEIAQDKRLSPQAKAALGILSLFGAGVQTK